MVKTHRVSLVAAVIVSFVVVHGNVALFASDRTQTATDTIASASPVDMRLSTPSPRLLDLGAAVAAANLTLSPTTSAAFAQVRRGRPYRAGRGREGSIAALVLGATAAIAGAAVLVYANRPECSTNQFAGGCGYGTKVIGGAVLTGGAAGLVIGALTW